MLIANRMKRPCLANGRRAFVNLLNVGQPNEGGRHPRTSRICSPLTTYRRVVGFHSRLLGPTPPGSPGQPDQCPEPASPLASAAGRRAARGSGGAVRRSDQREAVAIFCARGKKKTCARLGVRLASLPSADGSITTALIYDPPLTLPLRTPHHRRFLRSLSAPPPPPPLHIPSTRLRE